MTPLRAAFEKRHPLGDEVPGVLRKAFYRLYRDGWNDGQAAAPEAQNVAAQGQKAEALEPDNVPSSVAATPDAAAELPPLPDPNPYIYRLMSLQGRHVGEDLAIRLRREFKAYAIAALTANRKEA